MWIRKLFLMSPQKRLYIIPTLDGLKLLVVNILLLIIGLIYANNYVLLFNFLLFCLFIASMFYTHFNLQNLSCENISTTDVYANNNSTLTLRLNSSEKFLRTGLISKALLSNIMFSSKSFDYNSENQYATIDFKLPKRGLYPIGRIEIQTEFPFHLFRSFVYFNFKNELVVYPELKTNMTIRSYLESIGTGDLSDYYIREYRRGDNASRIIWKKSINDQFIVREFENELEEGIVFEVTHKSTSSLEDELSNITSLIHDCHIKKIPFGLATNKVRIEATSFDRDHMKKCLKELAMYEC